MKHQKFKTKTWLPIAVIRDAVKNEWVSSLAVLVMLKGIHNNNTFYNYSTRSIAKLIGLSHSTVHKHLKVLIDKNLIVIRNNNLTIRGVRKVAKERGNELLLPISKEKKHSKNLTTIKNVIKSTLIVRNIQKQKKAITEKSEVIMYCNGNHSFIKNTKHLKKVKRSLAKFSEVSPEKNFNNQTMLSLGKIGSLIKRSQETGKRFKKQLIDLGLITSRKNSELVCNRKYTRRDFFMMELPKGYFLSKAGYLYLNKPCLIETRLK